ncbi:MAG: cytochrome-c oxidase, cbb3-type subunit I [Prolixibacteraceae bacterium]|nr:cytochrome-c oxidase, cbb3-type subunit I [Prolixibacteraceae bacterium]
MEVQKFNYDNAIVRNFILATLVWGAVALLVGLVVALELAFPALNLGIEYISFGRVRPVHTNAVIFAFIGNAMFAGVYYSLQRVLKARLFNDMLGKVHFWLWQLIIVFAAVTLLAGFTTGKEYAELEWPIDLLIAVAWLCFGANMIGTVVKRREKHIYTAVWWYLATFIGVTILHVVNSIELPVSFLKSYPIYAGAQDAVVQWWYGHNAVAFFLTTPFLGLMYYYLPKASGRPIYSYQLSIIHFWSLIFLYMWAGPHHLLYQSLPDWVQALGVTFSIMLIAPSWGGMINGLMTLRGAWDKVREDPGLKFMVIAITAYGMATFEGPMMSLKSVNAVSHFTDWTIAHTHIAGMAWNGGMIFGMFYWLVPKLFKTPLHSKKLANTHFWIATLGILLFAIPLYWAAITQWLMLREYTPDGLLAYPIFMETTIRILPMYHIRILGGALYFTGFIIFLVNMLKTISAGSLVANEPAEAPAMVKLGTREESGESPHRWLERKGVRFAILVFIALSIGGIVEIIPMMKVQSNIPTISTVTPYTPLELTGRDIYISNGCYNCHSQQVRPLRFETDRYGEYSKIGEFVYDHPFQWGSRRTGPDLARAGYLGSSTYKTSIWHFNHFMKPNSVVPRSIMPAYPFLVVNEADINAVPAKIRGMRMLGVPYQEGFDKQAIASYMADAQKIADELKLAGVDIKPTKEVIAVIAYLHKLGRDISPAGSPASNAKQ